MDNRKGLQKAAILTWCYNNGSINYGQILQCYAMQVFVRRLGYDVKVVKYRKRDANESLFWGDKLELLTGLYEIWYRLKKVEHKIDIRILKFIGFIKRNISLSKQCYTKQQIEKECEDCEVLFCGSDQIWNPATFDDVYALNFGTDYQKRIAYAPSGIWLEHEWTEPIYWDLGKCLERFDLITIREKESMEILKKYTKKDIIDVVDPTLLLSKEDWDQVASKKVLEVPYIFCYFLGRIRPYKLLLKKIMQKYNAQRIYFTTPGEFERENEQNKDKYFWSLRNAGPAEFIALIRDAKAVCTDSFHGLALSIVYQKQFYIFERNMADRNLWANSLRQKSLLEKIGIDEKRLIRSLKELEFLADIDYNQIQLGEKGYVIKNMVEKVLEK